MYFNETKVDTNIDNNFNTDQKNSNNNNNILKIFIVIGIILIISAIILFIVKSKNNNKINLVLEGNTDITIRQGESYIEPGFKAYDNKGKDYTSSVTVDGSVNTNIIGEYIINYRIKNVVKSRNISVISNDNNNIYLILKGNSIVYLKLGDEYIEDGYTLIGGSQDSVKIEKSYNKDVPGTYKITYSATNKNGYTVSTTRTIIVTDSNINLSYIPKEKTNNEVTINFNISDNYFSHVILPDGKKYTNRSGTYIVNKNGKYKFTAYSSDGSYKESTIDINNIDTSAPIIKSCTGTITNGKTTFTVSSTDDDIKKYVFNGKHTSENKTYTINSEITSCNVEVYDTAGNIATHKCTATYTYEKPITPKGNENIIVNENTDKLKVWIEKKNRSGRTSYYVTHIWAMNPYNQLKASVPDNFGNQLQTASVILKEAINKKELANKLVVGINGSGFVLANTFSDELYKLNSGWNKTMIGPSVIVEGKTLRNFAGTVNTKYSAIEFGLKKDGYFGYYVFNKGDTKENHAKVYESMINDGILNAWAWDPVLVYNSKVMTTNTSKNIRNSICQIDKNNFVFVTDVYNNARNGFSPNELANYMVSIGCKHGFNLDGGGSTTLIYKKKNDSNISKITGDSRNIADILYFHE